MGRRQELTTIANSYDQLRSDFSAMKHSKFRRPRSGNSSVGSGADYHLMNEPGWLRALEYARAMDRDDILMGPLLDRSADVAIRDGIDPDPDTGDKGLDRDLSSRWESWGNDPDQCDTAGELTFDQMEWQAFRQAECDGDIVGLLTKDGSIQRVEAHRIRTPRNTKRNVVNGVMLDEDRRRLEYWITKDDIDPKLPLVKVDEIVRRPVRDAKGNRILVHLRNSPKRCTQTRGFSALWPMIDYAGMFEDTNFATLVKQQIASCFVIIRNKGINTGKESAPLGPQAEETMKDGNRRILQGISPGMEIEGELGETLEGFAPHIPSTEYFEHMRLILTLLSISLGLPLCVGLMDAGETNFSGFRGALDVAKFGWRRNQKWMVNQWHRPIYLWKVRNWLNEDSALLRASLKSGVKIYNHRWKLPAWPYIEPNKDAMGNTVRLKTSQTSPRRLHAEGGQDYTTVIDECIEDNFYAIDRALEKAAELNKKHNPSTPIHWRDVVNLPTGEGITVKIPEGPEPESENNPAKKSGKKAGGKRNAG